MRLAVASGKGGTGKTTVLRRVFPRASYVLLEDPDVLSRVKADPRGFMAQPTLTLSTVPTLIGNQLAPRHVDMRPFVLQSGSLYATTGGLTRVALPEGSLVVNSSQGGGSKDTWIVEDT